MPEGAKILIHGALVEGTQESDANGKGGMVTLTLIREGFGNKRDNHFYPKELLEGFAKTFEGAQMYSNHLSPELQKKLKGLPRDIQDLMGRIREAWVDKDEDGRTVVRGKASISQKWLWDMVEHDPELLGVSINARGSSTKGMKEGREANIVEAISDVGSVDWVSKAGAGGKVFALMEAQAEEEGFEIESGDGDAATTDDSGDSPATITHHHHDHHESVGAGKHKHVHSHSHPNAVEGESHRHVEVLEQPELAEADPENPGDPSASTSHSHDHVHEASEGPGDHLHVHHHHHQAVPGEVHSHEGSTEDDGGEETPSDAGSSSGDGDSETTTPETPAGEDADKGGEGGEDDAATTEAAASAGDLGGSTVHHHYHHHGSMGGGMHTHRHHHKTVAGETHEHVVDSGAGNPDAQGYDSPAKAGTHNHHHHHASMGKGKHVHHHTHELVGSREAHAHQMEPLQEAGGEDEGTETTVNEAGDTITSIDEANWIAGAIKHKGALHKDTGVPEGEKIPVAVLEQEAKKPGKVGKRARLALTLMKLRKKRKKKGSTKEGEYEYSDWDLDTDEVVEADIEARANEIATEKLREGVRAAVEMARNDFDKKLKEAVAENDFEWGRKLSQLEQRHISAAVIEASELPVATQKALKAEYHDRFFEDKRDSKNGSVRKAGVDLCRESVEARIEKKREELKEAGAATHVNESGETAFSRTPGESDRSGETRAKRASLDAEIDQELELDAGEKQSVETA